MKLNRRDFFKTLAISPLVGCATKKSDNFPDIYSLPPSTADDVTLLPGLHYDVLLSWKDPISKNLKFGTHNDYLHFTPLSADNGILWVNHEYLHPIFIKGMERTKQNILAEMKEVGGSLVEIKKVNGKWKPVLDSKFNRRIDATTMIPFANNVKVLGKSKAQGTMANCAGGYTPWGTVLTCEENYEMFYGEVDYDGKRIQDSDYKWEKFIGNDPRHYGWVVEIDPKTGNAQKHTSLGRCAHECANYKLASDGRAVFYTGDDHNDEHIYKFIPDKKDSLDTGKLYVLSSEKGKWISLQREDHPILIEKFKDQLDILINVRMAAKLVGATPFDRPEDIEVDPISGDVLVATTNNKPKGRPFGKIIKIVEKNNDAKSLECTVETFLTGGPENNFACPDNMHFDKNGNLWFTTDMAGYDINKGMYPNLGNNSLFLVPRKGEHAGEVLRIAICPVAAEFTGIMFSPDSKTMFISVQHPGETTTDLKNPTSTWPHGGLPKSSVITLEGELLEKLIGA